VACKLLNLHSIAYFDICDRVIFDPRIWLEYDKGYIIAVQFGTEELVKRWVKMTLPDLPEVKAKLADMEKDLERKGKIRLNFIFSGETARSTA
jgi:hypothetical protein